MKIQQKQDKNKQQSVFSWFKEGKVFLGNHGSLHDGFFNVFIDSFGDDVVLVYDFFLFITLSFISYSRFYHYANSYRFLRTCHGGGTFSYCDGQQHFSSASFECSSSYTASQIINYYYNSLRLQHIQIKFLIISLFTINFSSSSKRKFQKYMKMKPSSSKIVKYQSGNLILKSTEDRGALVLGDCNSAMDKKIHKQFKIQTVISIGQQAMPIKSKLPQNCNHYFYVIHDNKSQKVPPQLFDEINNLIEQGRGKGGVLVHCYAGVSRSSTFVIGYIMQKFNRTYEKAREEVKVSRNCIYPNDGFVHHLKTYQKALQKRQQQRLRRIQELRRLEIDKSLVQSARKSVRGGVRGAGLSPQQGKEMSHQGRKNYQQFIIEAIEMKNELKSVKEEKDDSEMAKIKNNIPLNNIESKNSVTEKINCKNIFFTKPIVNSVQRKQGKEDVKLPKMNEKIISGKDTQRRMGIKSQFMMQKKQKIRPVVTLMKSISISREQILKKSSTANVLRKGSQDSTIRSQNRTACMKDSRSVFSVAKQKSFGSEVDLSVLNEHEKRVKKIYETKVIVK